MSKVLQREFEELEKWSFLNPLIQDSNDGIDPSPRRFGGMLRSINDDDEAYRLDALRILKGCWKEMEKTVFSALHVHGSPVEDHYPPDEKRLIFVRPENRCELLEKLHRYTPTINKNLTVIGTRLMADRDRKPFSIHPDEWNLHVGFRVANIVDIIRKNSELNRGREWFRNRVQLELLFNLVRE
ncbi:hypothetical protein [Thalassoglobus neptunius]|uniref:hypothetical protein n=1 Tax=Thalassoglobus neptunius TaxID=1938619 RepID=UPI0011B7D003|nr:hypothetical protein [Thalassoglobus neptunius]